MKSASKICRCIVVDDEPLAREVLVRYVERIPSLQLVGQCSNAIEAIEILKQNSVDIIFLDIQMPEILGIDLIKILKNPPSVIITSAFQEYAIEGYELDVVDYLLKPIKFERFLKSITKVYRRHDKEPDNSDVDEESAEPQKERYLFFRTDRRTVKVMQNDILYVEGMGNYVKVFTEGGVIITKSSMTTLETMLPEDGFIRTHRSFIVSKAKINSFNNEVVEIGKHQIPIGKLFKNNVLRALGS
ncbi:LytR/AlgR family response regulator transcription factor [Chryseolinea lacunae]|uniref:Response regulator transcription factor n=1 Tax=Chryseolinea lacunae TaxID=2801331 RepID=A0ABS1KMB3_9BACT|nr:LytTR family DNA-binding domain-containing protein [Chryseolinea lacunae]MBL0740604.1 response regulator transcription factor [Chryseolinea lacunae]